MDAMWKWINDTIRDMVKNLRIDARIGDADDIAQETLMYLYDRPNIAESVYEQQSRSLLYSIVKKILFRETAKWKGVKRDTLSHYNRISEVCESYKIPKTPENAYKISGLLGKPFSIPYVKGILTSIHELDEGFDDRKAGDKIV